MSDPNPVMTAAVPELPREIAPGVYWMGGCNASDAYADEIHMHVSAFLVVGKDKTLMYDTSLPDFWDEIQRQVSVAMGDRPLDYVVPSHAEVPHGGNIERLLLKYPDAVAVGDMRDYHLYFPNVAHRFQNVELGTELDLGGGYAFTILDAPIQDAPNTVWGYEKRQQVLFTSDAFAFSHHAPLDDGAEGAHHLPGECAKFSHELGAGFPSVEQASVITKAALYWTRFVPIEPFLDEVQKLLDTYPTRIVVPSHGNVITNLDEIMPVIQQAHRDVYAGDASVAAGV
jgi:flavorubredoxin